MLSANPQGMKFNCLTLFQKQAGASNRILGQGLPSPTQDTLFLSYSSCSFSFSPGRPLPMISWGGGGKGMRGGIGWRVGEEIGYTFCTQLTKRDKPPHAKAKITIKMLTSLIST